MMEKALTHAEIAFVKNEPMANHTTFRIGGPADLFVKPKDVAELLSVLASCRELGISPLILGNGSNILVSDAGIRGVVVSLTGLDGIIENQYNRLTAYAGTKLSKLALFAKDRSLSGLEFSYGIPGTVGGAAYMNAGAYGGEMKDVVISSLAVLPDGTVREFTKGEHHFAYRHSVFAENGAVLISCDIQLTPGDKAKIEADMEQLMARRMEKQPLEYPSAGSVFKRPEGYYAGKLIEDAGLKGYTIGGAQVSEKHAGFIVNKGGATYDDVKSLIDHIKNTVLHYSGILLESEIKQIG